MCLFLFFPLLHAFDRRRRIYISQHLNTILPPAGYGKQERTSSGGGGEGRGGGEGGGCKGGGGEEEVMIRSREYSGGEQKNKALPTWSRIGATRRTLSRLVSTATPKTYRGKK